MKKAFAILLAMILGISMLTACGGSGSGNGNNPPASQGSSEPSAPATTIIGQWEYESGGYTYEFKDDGTGTYTIGSDDV